MFKKKTLKFTYQKVSRDLRHVEALKARESSRFKRLSILRSINDSDLSDKNMNTSKKTECKIPEKKPSRLEMLFKWKQEKQIKKEMEKTNKKKPFYVGGNKTVAENKGLQNFKSSFIAQPNSSFNSSKFVKSKLVTPNAPLQPSRILNSKQGALVSTNQSVKAPNPKQGVLVATNQSSKVPNIKQAASSLPKTSSSLTRSNSTAVLSRKFPPSVDNKTTSSLIKTGTNLSRSNSVATLSRKFPTSSLDKIGALPKPGSNLIKSSNMAAPSRKLPIPSSTITKAATSNPTINNQRTPVVNRIPNSIPTNSNVGKSKNLSKPINKGLLKQNSFPKQQEEKPVKKAGVGLNKITSKVASISRGIPVQSKMPVSNMDKKFGSNPKLNLKETSQSKENLSRRGYCFKSAITNYNRQLDGVLQKTPMQGTPKKRTEKILKAVEEKPATKEFSDQSLLLDSIPDVTFNSDISIIKPTRTSFAPTNFTFRPPEGLNNFILDDDDDDFDVYQVLEDVKQKFMSRTSTPSKDSGRKSSTKNSKESLGNNVMTDVEKMSDVSNSYDIRISELMTPESFKVELGKEEAVNAQIHKEVTSDIVEDVEIQGINSDINQQTCLQEADVSAKKSISEEITPDSLCDKITNSEIKSKDIVENQLDFVKDYDTAVNKEACVASISDAIANIEILGAGIDVNQQTCVEEFASANQEEGVELTSDSANGVITDIEIKNTGIDRNQQACVEGVVINQEASVSPIKTEVKVDKTLNQQASEEQTSSKNEIPNKIAAEEKIVSEVKEFLFDENAIVVNNNSKQFSQSLNNGASKTTGDVFLDDDDSLLDSVDLNIQLMKLDDDTDEDDFPSPQIVKCPERKSNGAVPKRVSMLKKLSVMNSIAETNEADDYVSVSRSKSSKKKESPRYTPRRSKRISNLISVDTLAYSPVEQNLNSTIATPRRSMRLRKKSDGCDSFPLSPFQEKKRNSVNLRRSVRLIDLSTPEKAACEKLLGENFENLDPNNFLIDFETPPTPVKSKKVSLLYSPDKRKSIRKSIRGDLISFSPV